MFMPAKPASGQGHSVPEIWLYNLRTMRPSQGRWKVWIDEREITVSASSQTAHRDKGVSSWAIRVTGLEAVGKLIKATSSSGSVEMDAEYGTVDLEVSAKWKCQPKDARVPVRLQMEFQDDKGQIFSRQVDVDYTCLLGDIRDDQSAASLVKIAHRHWKDPHLVRLLANAPKSKPKLADELKYLKKSFLETSYQVDPEDEAVDWIPGRAYTLSPSDIFRYSGDCEDYAILVGAYLTQRGFPSWLVAGPSHAWVEVEEDGQRKLADILDSSPKYREHATRAFVGQPPAKAEFP